MKDVSVSRYKQDRECLVRVAQKRLKINMQRDG